MSFSKAKPLADDIMRETWVVQNVSNFSLLMWLICDTVLYFDINQFQARSSLCAVNIFCDPVSSYLKEKIKNNFYLKPLAYFRLNLSYFFLIWGKCFHLNHFIIHSVLQFWMQWHSGSMGLVLGFPIILNVFFCCSN